MTNPHFIERTACPGCHHPEFETLYTCGFLDSPVRDYLVAFYTPQGPIDLDALADATYQLVRCRHCQMVYQTFIGDDVLLEKLYDQWLDADLDYEQHVRSLDLNAYAMLAQEIMTVIAALDLKPHQITLLDFGTGWGRYPQMAKAFGCTAYASELSQRRAAYFEEQGVENLAWDDIPTHQFDFISTEQVFEHLPRPLETLRHLKQALKPNGMIKISVPNGQDIDRRLGVMDWQAAKGSSNSLNPVAPLEHINCFRHDSILKMAELAGMDEVRLPILDQIAYSTNWKPGVPLVKNLLRPFYQNLSGRSTRVFLRPKSG